MSSMKFLAAAAMAMILAASAAPAEAAKQSLSAKQVKQIRSIVRQEIAKIPGPRGSVGPAGPAGPAGPLGPPGPQGTPGDASGGFEVRFAHIGSGGFVDPAHSRGITQDNIVLSEFPDFEDPDTLYGQFCIVGLPPPLGGQVSSDLDTEGSDFRGEQLDLTGDGACVIVEGPPFDGDRGFHVLLLY